MINNNYICALDIGSSKIAASVALFNKKRLTNVFFDYAPIRGVKEGAIVDAIELVGVITKLLKSLKAKSGINIKSLYANISGLDIDTKHSRAIIPLVERGNKVITVSDIQRVIEQARILGSNLEEEIIHEVPSGYTIDSKSNIANPLGLYSHKLEVDLYLVYGKLSSIQSLSRVISQSGYDMKDLFFSGLATSKVVFNEGLKEGTHIFCDIGSDITEILIFNDGVLRDMEILNIGGDYFTKQISDVLKIPVELAEEIKRSYGVIGDAERIGEEKEILVKKSNLYKPIKQKLVSQIITSSAQLICSSIKESIEKRIPAFEVRDFTVVGRTILLEGFIETMETILSMPVKMGRVSNSEIAPFVQENDSLSGQKYLTYLTCLGMICKSLEKGPLGVLPIQQPAKNLFVKTLNRFKEAYQEYF
ncbi:MAG: cell division protein FtsA [Candidatus Omnitrophica bacterium]|nr:cell division protein FtsA [Candidatus Omnitrophota bacterium]